MSFKNELTIFVNLKRGIDDVRESTNNVSDKEDPTKGVLLTSITFSQFFNFRFKDWTKVMKLTESDVDEPSTECCSKSVLDCKGNLCVLLTILRIFNFPSFLRNTDRKH